jgi:K+-sensing histidine kinase KdpD
MTALRTHGSDRARHWPVLVALVGIPLLAAALIPLRGHVENTNIALVLVVAVVAVGLTAHRLAAVVAALSAAFWFDFFFTVPFNSPTIASGDDALTAGLLLLVGLVVGELSAWALRQRDEAVRGRADVARIHQAAERMARGESSSRIVDAVAEELRDLLFLRACRFDPGPGDPLLPRVEGDGSVQWGDLEWATASLGLPSKGVVLEVAGNGRPAGCFTLVPTPGVQVGRDRLVVAIALADQVGATFSGAAPA